MWITFLLKMITWYPYYILFGFLRSDVEEYNISQANKAYSAMEKPLRFACWCVVGVHAIIVGILSFIGVGLWAAVS